jgi:hypothetical protein
MDIQYVDGNERVVPFTRWFFGLRSGEVPCLQRIEVFDGGDNDARKEAIWSTEQVAEIQCVGVKSFIVGKAPKGFQILTPLQGLKRRQPYTIRVYGIGRGEAKFELP